MPGNTPSTTLKIAVLAPMPSARVNTATAGEARIFGKHAYNVPEVLPKRTRPTQAIHPAKPPRESAKVGTVNKPTFPSIRAAPGLHAGIPLSVSTRRTRAGRRSGKGYSFRIALTGA